MATPKVPWRLAIEDLLADGQPRTLDEIVEAVGGYVPAGQAVRRREQLLARQVKYRRVGAPFQGRRSITIDEVLRIGVRDTVRECLWGAVHAGKLVRTVDGRYASGEAAG